tara:strand:- start:3292 stop:3714 length:423 start_codon:yes stop_codon:yes gene_type:complete
MRIILSNTEPTLKNYTWVKDISSLDKIVDDAEATEILVDNFLSSFNFSFAGEALKKILSKLRTRGTITIYVKDISLICHNVASLALDISDINSLFFEDSQAIASVLNLSNVSDILTQCGLTVKEKHLNVETCQGIIVAER